MEHHHRARTYTLKFIRDGKLLDAEIHQDCVDACNRVLSWVEMYCASSSRTDVDWALLAWDEVDGPFHWTDGEYEIYLDGHTAKQVWDDKNVCEVIQFRRSGT